MRCVFAALHFLRMCAFLCQVCVGVAGAARAAKANGRGGEGGLHILCVLVSQDSVPFVCGVVSVCGVVRENM